MDIMHIIQDNFKSLISAFNILIVVSPSILGKYPNQTYIISYFTRPFSWIDVSELSRMIPFGCTTLPSDHVTRLLTLTLAPIVCACVWFITYFIISRLVCMIYLSNKMLIVYRNNLKIHFVYYLYRTLLDSNQ